MLENAKICQKMQGNVRKCKEMLENARKCQKMQRYVRKCKKTFKEIQVKPGQPAHLT